MGDHLLTQGAEAFLRSASSRHYYAAYHAATGWLQRLPGMHSIGGPAGGVHQQLLNGLRAPDPATSPAAKLQGRKLAAKLDVMRARRRVADYLLTDGFATGEAQHQAQLAAELLALCNPQAP